MDRHGRTMRVNPEQTRLQLGRAGFCDIHESSVKVFYSPWSEDPREKEVALWFRAGFSRGIKALSYGPMTTYLGMSVRDIDSLCEAVIDELHLTRYKPYCRMWVGRRESSKRRRLTQCKVCLGREAAILIISWRHNLTICCKNIVTIGKPRRKAHVSQWKACY
jgi:hypothetical protein